MYMNMDKNLGRMRMYEGGTHQSALLIYTSDISESLDFGINIVCRLLQRLFEASASAPHVYDQGTTGVVQMSARTQAQAQSLDLQVESHLALARNKGEVQIWSVGLVKKRVDSGNL